MVIKMNSILKYAAAVALVVLCSAEVRAQQGVPQGMGVGYGQSAARGGGGYYGGSYSGYGNYTYNNNCTGCFPGSGPYDSQIAVTGIAAGASVLNGLIGAVAASRQQPQVVVVQQPRAAVTPNCSYYQVGNDSNGRPLYSSSCN